jgi:two-component system cell cycle response regulator
MGLSSAVVLVAEDSATQRTFVSKLLTEQGFEVHQAPDGRVALDLCRILRPDLLMLDLNMPELTGGQVLKRVRADHVIGATPVLVFTSDDRATTVCDVLDGGATDFVPKSVRPGELLARVRRVLREKARVDDLVERNRALAEMADVDALTGLPNRRASGDALAQGAAKALESGGQLTVALVDIDHFKAINDTYGHSAGDQVLSVVAARLRAEVGSTDLVGRWGGEEFIAVLPGANRASAAATAEALRAANAGQAIEVGMHMIAVTVSIGWASASGAMPDLLVELADAALYRAKADGRNRVRAA